MKILNFFKQVIFILYITLLSTLAFADAGDDDRGIEDSRTFHIFDDVDLVSTLKFEYGKPNIVIKSVYPQLASETEREGINNFNDLTQAIVQDEINQFRNKVKEYAFVQKTLPRNKITNNLYVDYDTSFVKAKKDHIISVRFAIQGLITGIPQPYHHHRAINYNLDTSQEIQLSDLFIPGSNYLSVLSAYTSNSLYRSISDRQAIANGTAAISENYQIWNIKPTGLLITFEKSQVAPSIQGTQTVYVPYSALLHVASPDSLIANCINYKRRCASTNVLTGGFIDEAAKRQPEVIKVAMRK